tara:strand:+ start:537 stop:899 length:363 start_codon:yes stop_codon:yes gene_type:complete
MEANDTQIGGAHYKKGDNEEHWDRAWRLKYDPFQYIITKWVERHKDKNGLEDLRKARHAIDKYIEVLEAEQPPPLAGASACTCGMREGMTEAKQARHHHMTYCPLHLHGGVYPQGYVDQD